MTSTTTHTAATAERAEGLQLLGAVGGSGYSGGTFMVRRQDGQTIQLTPLLYQLLDVLESPGSDDDLASRLSQRSGRDVRPADVHVLLERLEKLGLMAGTEIEAAPRSNPLLALRWKVVISRPEATRRLTAPFAWLFSPWLLWPVLAAFVAVCWFVLVDKGLASATHRAFQTPGLLLGVFLLAVVSAGFHELGHAAACRYSGAQPGAMGAGIYLVWPAFYTNVDDAYRLDRKGRLRVDLGGLYFNALVAVAVTGLWLLTHEDALLLGVAAQLLQMLHQLTPIIRADGYHILADWTGVPDLYAHLGPTLRRLLPGHRSEPSPLTRRARWIVTAWVAVVIPVLVALLLTAILVLPRLVATAWVSGRAQLARMGHAAEAVDFLGFGAGLLRLVALVLPVAGTTYLAVRMVRRTTARTMAATENRPVARGFATLAAVLVAALLAWAWWPSGQYRPVSLNERGTIASLFSNVANRGALGPHQQVALAMVPHGAAAADHPVMLVTRDHGQLRTVVTTTKGGAGHALPFALPGPKAQDETRALATNTRDGGVVYDVAYAVVTVTDGAPVTATNDAWALASCTKCTTVAVSFQVVLVVGQSNVITPVNAAVAANGNCIQCMTTAMAVQLIVTLNKAPDADVMQKLNAALGQLDAVKGLSPADLLATVQKVQQQVTTILSDAGLVTSTTTSTTTATASPGPTPGDSIAPTAGATSVPQPSQPTPSESAAEATPSATATPTPEATSSP